MKTALWVTLTLSTLALAGCTEDVPSITEEDCLVDGLTFAGSVLQEDEEGESFIGPGCLDCSAPGHSIETVADLDADGNEVLSDQCVLIASVEMTDLPDTLTAYTPIELTWTLHTELGQSHSHNNGIRVSTTSDPTYGSKVDGYGKGLLDGNEEHRDFVDGDSSTVTWTPQAPGTYYVRAYAVSTGGNFWSAEQTVVVEPVAPTGNGIIVNVTGGGTPASSLDPAAATIALGDSITWKSNEPVWTIERTRGPDGAERFNVDLDEEYVFTVPGSYAYEAVARSPDGENEIGRVEGTITVTGPA